MTDKKTFFYTGTVQWAKIVGPPRMDNLAGRTMWSVDFYPDNVKEVIADIKKYKINKKLKDKELGKCITFTRNGKTAKGEDMPPIPIYGPDNSPWDGSLIGNGSKVTVRFKLNNSPKYGNIVWVEAIKVLEHVPYTPSMFPEDDENPEKEDNFLDDDLPF